MGARERALVQVQAKVWSHHSSSSPPLGARVERVLEEKVALRVSRVVDLRQEADQGGVPEQALLVGLAQKGKWCWREQAAVQGPEEVRLLWSRG